MGKIKKETKGKFKALFKRSGNRKAGIRDFVDYDYLEDLSEEELNFMNKFTKEYYEGNLDHSKQKHPNRVQIHPENNDCYDLNNTRNSDLFSDRKGKRQLTYTQYEDKWQYKNDDD